MRARRRHAIPTLLFAVSIAVSALLAIPAGQARADGPICVAGTAWDNRLRRCV